MMDDCDPSGRPQKSPRRMCNLVFQSHMEGVVTQPKLLPVVPAQLEVLCNIPGSAWEPLLHAACGPCGHSCLNQSVSAIIAVLSVR